MDRYILFDPHFDGYIYAKGWTNIPVHATKYSFDDAVDELIKNRGLRIIQLGTMVDWTEAAYEILWQVDLANVIDGD